MTTRTAKDIKQDLLKLVEEANNFQEQKLINKIKQHAAELDATAAAIDHAEKAAAYVNFKESEKYVNSLRKEMAETGTVLTDTFNGNSIAVKNIAGDSFRTFDQLKAGRVLKSAEGSLFLATSFTEGHGGSETTLIRLGHKCQASNEPVTPYSGVPCSFDYRSGRLIVAKHDAIKSDTVIIGGKTYVIKSQFLNRDNFHEYVLEQV